MPKDTRQIKLDPMEWRDAMKGKKPAAAKPAAKPAKKAPKKSGR